MSSSANIPKPTASGLINFEVKAEDFSVSNNYHVLSINIFKAINKVPSAKIIIADGFMSEKNEDFIGDNEHFVPGKKITVSAGYGDDKDPVFEGIIVKQSIERSKNCRNIVIECKDTAVKLTVAKKDAKFSDKKDSEIIKEIAEAAGLKTGSLDDVTIENKENPRYQCQLTDWDFILGLAEANGVLILADIGTLAVKKPDMSTKAVLSLEEGDTMLEFKATSDARNQVQAVKTKTWDPANQEFTEVEGADPGVPEQGTLKAKELAKVTGPEVVALAAGVLSEQEIQAQADAVLLRSRLAKIKGSAKCYGVAKIQPGDIVELLNVGKSFSGNAFVASVRHIIGKAKCGWITELQFGLDTKSPTPRSLTKADPPEKLKSTIAGLQIGKVTQLKEDPKGEDRVMVKIPAIAKEDEGTWARIACLDAGENRGAFFRPEIDDEVILGFLEDDPRYPVILGMLNSSAKPAPVTATDENHEKGFTTREQLKFMFNDEKKIITIETPNGNKITISDDDAGINLQDENNNQALMNADGITLKDANGSSMLMSADGIVLESGKDIIMKATGNVKIEGINIETKASAQLKGEGSAGAELSAGGNTVIKGAMVMIN